MFLSMGQERVSVVAKLQICNARSKINYLQLEYNTYIIICVAVQGICMRVSVSACVCVCVLFSVFPL